MFSFLGLWITTLFPEDFELFLGFFLIFTFGMIHGSNDMLIVNKLTNLKKTSFIKTLAIYLLVVSIAVLIFYWLPGVALILFVCFSAYHFGEQHWEESLESITNTSKRLYFFAYGLFVLFMVFYFNEASVKMIVNEISGMTLNQLYTEHVLITLGVFMLSFLAVMLRQKEIKLNTVITELFTLLVLVIIFKSSSLIWGFTIYFIIWHSIPSLLEQIRFAYGSLDRKNIINYTKAALPYWLVSLVGMTLLYFVFKDEKHFYSLFFAFIAAVTFPHSIVMLKMFTKKSKHF
ncbi:Brp/Blh family beta-carotene 15,15'-dioxygenase [Flavobacteriaceae bacterium]|nr:Brp/Blh family beta-carotene 15,15'-dioxygenase [Flavobacteriaceae bacterium]